jgi:hypothetical protein
VGYLSFPFFRDLFFKMKYLTVRLNWEYSFHF